MLLVIPDELCQKAGLTLSWSGELKFGVHAFDPSHRKINDRVSDFAPCNPKIHNIRVDSALFHPIARRLVAESNGYFLAAEKLAQQQPRSGNFQSEILKLSRIYRSVLRVCLTSFQTEADLADPKDKQNYLQHIPSFYNMELIWHLSEILFIDVLPGHLVLGKLISWIRFHIPHVETEALRLLESSDTNIDEDEEYYWQIIIDCLLQRRIETVRALLMKHSQHATDPFVKLDQIIQTMPIFEVYGGLSGAEFQVRYDNWRREATRLHRTGIFSVDPNLDIVIKILIGDDSVQELIRKHCETWYQHMVASLIYKSPTVKIFDLSFHANRSITLFGGPETITELDWILAAIMEIDIYKMVDKLLDWNHSDWLLTHLIHLLSLLGKLSTSSSTEMGHKLCERVLLDYGSLLMSHKSLWQIGVDYLDHCPNEGKAHLELLLPRIPFKTNEKAVKIMTIAIDRGLYDIASSVAKVQGLRCISRGELGSALSWGIRSKDPVFCSQLADIFLHDYIKNGRFQALDVLENLGVEMMLGDRLVFLGKYCEYLRLQKTNDFRDAANLLVLLLKNKVVPNYFWLTVFKDSMSLIKSSIDVFTSSDILDLMSSLQDLIDNVPGVPEDVVLDIRKNLAVALICEGCYNL